MPARIISSTVEIQDPNIPIHKFILDKLKCFSEQTFLIEYENGNEYSYGNLLNDSLRVAYALKKSQLNPGDIFMVYGFNCYEYVVAIIAGLFVGGIALPVRGADTPSEFQKELETKDVRFLFIDSRLRDTAVSVKDKSTYIKDVILFDGIENDSEFKCIRNLSNKDNIALSENEIYDPQGNKDSIAIILESSGTTGPTKSTQLSHYNLSIPFFKSNSSFNEEIEGQILLGASPLAHLSGLTSCLFSLISGAKIISARNNTVENTIGAIEKYKVSRCILSPSTITQLVKLERPVDLSSLRAVYVGGSRLPKGLGEEFVEKYNINELKNAYTMTEITTLATCGESKMGSLEAIGKVAPGVKIKIVDTETGNILGENEVGEICVKSPLAFKGYYKNEQASKELLDADGFVKTGDVGYFDENEVFYCVDRIKEIIKQNSFGFSPVDIEEVLVKHEAVQEAAVVGIPDDVAGEISHAFVVLKNNINKATFDKQELIDFVNNEVSHLKQLKGGVHWVDELPKTTFGKILRRKLRADYLAQNICE